MIHPVTSFACLQFALASLSHGSTHWWNPSQEAKDWAGYMVFYSCRKSRCSQLHSHILWRFQCVHQWREVCLHYYVHVEIVHCAYYLYHLMYAYHLHVLHCIFISFDACQPRKDILGRYFQVGTCNGYPIYRSQDSVHDAEYSVPGGIFSSGGHHRHNIGISQQFQLTMRMILNNGMTLRLRCVLVQVGLPSGCHGRRKRRVCWRSCILMTILVISSWCWRLGRIGSVLMEETHGCQGLQVHLLHHLKR